MNAPAYPEHIIDEEAPKQDAASADVVQVQQLHPVEGECQPEEIVGNPVLRRTGKRDLGPAAHGIPISHGNESVSDPAQSPAVPHLPFSAGTRPPQHCSRPGTRDPWCQTRNSLFLEENREVRLGAGWAAPLPVQG